MVWFLSIFCYILLYGEWSVNDEDQFKETIFEASETLTENWRKLSIKVNITDEEFINNINSYLDAAEFFVEGISAWNEKNKNGYAIDQKATCHLLPGAVISSDGSFNNPNVCRNEYEHHLIRISEEAQGTGEYFLRMKSIYEQIIILRRTLNAELLKLNAIEFNSFNQLFSIISRINHLLNDGSRYEWVYYVPTNLDSCWELLDHVVGLFESDFIDIQEAYEFINMWLVSEKNNSIKSFQEFVVNKGVVNKIHDSNIIKETENTIVKIESEIYVDPYDVKKYKEKQKHLYKIKNILNAIGEVDKSMNAHYRILYNYADYEEMALKLSNFNDLDIMQDLYNVYNFLIAQNADFPGLKDKIKLIEQRFAVLVDIKNIKSNSTIAVERADHIKNIQLLSNSNKIELIHDDPKGYLNLEGGLVYDKEYLEDIVKKLKKDPIAIAQYVQNEIRLNHIQSLVNKMDLGGIHSLPIGLMQPACVTAKNKMGTHWDQCVLLVTLLRMAGVSAGYAQLENNGLPVSQGLFFNHLSGGGGNYSECKLGSKDTCVQNGSVNMYCPWVVVFDELQQRWIHLFPWLQEVGKEYLRVPDDQFNKLLSFDNVLKWCETYWSSSLKQYEEDNPSNAFLAYINEQLGNSDVDLDYNNRKSYYKKYMIASWEDFPRPINYEGKAIVHSDLNDSNCPFVQLDLKIYSENYPENMPLAVRRIRLCDLLSGDVHLRFEGNQLTIKQKKEENGQLNYETLLEINDLKSSSLSLALQLIRIMPDQAIKNGLGNPIDKEYLVNIFPNYELHSRALAALTINLGSDSNERLFEYLSKIKQKSDEHKEKWLEDLLVYAGLKYQYNLNQGIHKLKELYSLLYTFPVGIELTEISQSISEDGTLQYIPSIDVQYYLDPFEAKEAHLLLNIMNVSVNEHAIINEVFGDEHAVSTVGLFRETVKAGYPIIKLTVQDMFKLVADPQKFQQDHYPDIEYSEKCIFSNSAFLNKIIGRLGYTIHNLHLAGNVCVYMTPYRIGSQSQDNSEGRSKYEGFAAMIISKDNYAALITGNKNQIIQNGGFGRGVADQQFFSQGLAMKQTGVNRFTVAGLAKTVEPISMGKNILDSVSFQKFNAFSKDIPSLDGLKISVDIDKMGGIHRHFMFSKESGDQVATVKEMKEWLESRHERSRLSFKGVVSDVKSGLSSAYAKVADPVNLVSGAFYVDESDIEIQGSFPIYFRRSYSSYMPTESVIGYGWSCNLSPGLFLDGNKIYWQAEDGSRITSIYDESKDLYSVSAVFNPQLSNVVTSKGNIYNYVFKKTIIEDVDCLELETGNGYRSLFQVTREEGQYRLICEYDPFGNKLSYVYNKNDQLEKIISNEGHYIMLRYSPEGQIVEVEGSNGRRVAYDYDKFGDLIRVTNCMGAVKKYHYEKEILHLEDNAIEQSNHRLIKEIMPIGQQIKNVYDLQGRVIEQLVSFNDELVSNAKFEYDVKFNDELDFQVTKVKDANDNVTEYYIVNNLIYKIIDPEGNQILQSWYLDDKHTYFDAELEKLFLDASGKGFPRSLHSKRDQRGLRTFYSYDSYGNSIQEVIQGEITGDTQSDEIVIKKEYIPGTTLISEVSSCIGGLKQKFVRYYYDDNNKFMPVRIERYMQSKLIDSISFVYNNNKIKFIEKHNGEGILTEKAEYIYDNSFKPSKIIKYNTKGDSYEVKMEHDFHGNLRKVYYPNGSYSAYNYLLDGNVESILFYDSDSKLINHLAKVYRNDGALMYESDFNSHILYSRNPNGDPVHIFQSGTAILDEENKKLDIKHEELEKIMLNSYEYNVDGKLISSRDNNAQLTCYTYDALGRIKTKTRDSYKEFYEYEPGGQISKLVTPEGEMLFEYTQNGLLKKRVYSNGSVEQWCYDIEGRITEEHSRDDAWIYTYDDVKNKVTKINKEKKTEEVFAYNHLGKLIGYKDVNGKETVYEYDLQGRLTLLNEPDGKVTQYIYDDINNTLTHVSPKGNKHISKYDLLGNLIEEKILDLNNNIVSVNRYEYFEKENKKIINQGIDSDCLTSMIINNTQGQTVLIKSPNEGIIHNYYDIVGRLVRRDDQGKVTRFNYDNLDRLSEVVLSGGILVQYDYDLAGRISKITEPENRIWEFNYNDYGQLKSKRQPGGPLVQYVYDSKMRLSEIIANNEVIRYHYDDDSSEVSIIRLRDGQEVSRVKQTLNAQGVMEKETVALRGEEVSSVVRHSDLEGVVSGFDVKLGGKSKFFDVAYNAADWLTRNGAVNLDYDTAGRLQEVRNAQSQRTYKYTNAQPQTVFTSANHKTLLEEQLTWREGLIQSIASQGKQQIYKYDAHQFLKKAGSFDYYYAKDGSGGYGLKQGEDWFREGPGRTLFSSVEVPKMVVGEAENARNLQVLVNGKLKHHFPVEGKKRWSAEVNLPAGQTSTVCARVYDFEGLFEEDICNIEVPAEASSCDYDSEGRIIKRTYTNGKVQTFEWNAWGQLEKMVQEDPSGNNYTFSAQYDPLGRRIETIFKGQKTTYVYNPDVEFETLGHKDNTGVYWHHQSPQGLEAIEDSRGTLISLINNVQHHGVGHLEGSKVVHYNSPTPYGKIPGKKGLYQSYRGKPYDPTGLIYMGARYYDPEEAQFLSPDPYGYTGNTNLYTYANGDPINYYDPDGRLFQPALQKTGATISNVWNNERFQGGLTVFGGVGEVAGGIALATVGAPTVGLSVIGGALATHGADTFQTGLRKIWNNQHRATYAEDFMRSSGMNPTTAMFADTILSMASAGGLMKAGGVISKATIKFENDINKASIINKQPAQLALPYDSRIESYAGGYIKSFIQPKDQIYYRVYSDNLVGRFLVKNKPKSKEWVLEALSLPPNNKATYLQKVLVPMGTRLQRSRALPVPAFGRFKGGAEQFELLEKIPVENFYKGIPL